MAVALGGIALELVAGAVALAIAGRCRRPVAKVGLFATATILLLHAGFYLAAGTHHGFGDGRAPHDALGAWRPLLVVPVALAVVAGGYLLAARLAREATAGSLAGRSRAPDRSPPPPSSPPPPTALSPSASGRSPTTRNTPASWSTRRSAWSPATSVASPPQSRRAQGRPPTAAELAAARARLEEKHRPFPLAPILAVALGLACLAGLWRAVSRAHDSARDARWRAALFPAVICAGSVLLVAAIQALAP